MRHLSLLLLVLVLVSRAGAVLVSGPPSLAKDAGHYHDIAVNLAAGNGFAFSPENQYPWLQDGTAQPTARRPPLFPVVLSLFYRAGLGPTAMLWLNVLFAVGTAWALAGLARSLGLGERARLLVLLGYLLYPPFVLSVTRLLTEPMFMLGYTAAAWMLVEACRRPSARRFAALGLVLGLATLARPTTFLFPLALVPFLVWPMRRAPRGWAVLTLFFLLSMSPWIVRNAATFGRFEATFTSRGYNLFMGTYPPTRARSNLPPEQQPPDLVASFEGKDEFEVNRLYTRAAVHNVLSQPGEVAKLVAAKAVLLWFQTRAETMYLPTPRSFALNGPLLLLATAGFVVLVRRRTPGVWVPLVFVGYMVAMHLLSVSTLRYNAPSFPFLVLAAAAALDRFLPRARPPSTRPSRG